jgi:peroxiredoxin
LLAAGELSGRRAPGFSLPDVNLRQHDLGDYRGKIVLVDIMQTACKHCQTFVRTLEEVKAKYGPKVAILSVVNPPDTLDTVQRFVSRQFVTTPVLFDCGQMAASYLKVTPQNPGIVLPHLFIIDGEGMVRNDYAYAGNEQIFEGKALFAELDRMLTAPPATPKGKR